MGILDAALLVGAETTYGTAATLTRAYEAKADAWQREPEFLESIGMRPGTQTIRTGRRRKIDTGATGSLEVDVLTNGMGLLLDGLLGATTGPTAGVTEFATTSEGPSTSYTFQVLRPRVAGGVDPFTYVGAVATGWRISQEVGGLLVLSIDFDAQAERTDVAAGVPTFVEADPFDWTHATVTVAGEPVVLQSIEVEASLALKTDRRGLRGSALKRQPRRNALPEFTGTIAAEYEDRGLFDLFVAGEPVEIEASWDTGSHSITVTMPACQFDGNSPTAALDDLTSQELPFRVLHNGTDPAISITVENDDTTL